jgi:hypothetical protein
MRVPRLEASREAPMNATDRGLKKGWSEAVVKTRSRISERLTLSSLGATEKSISTHSSSTFEWSEKPDWRNVSSIGWFSIRVRAQKRRKPCRAASRASRSRRPPRPFPWNPSSTAKATSAVCGSRAT